MNYTFFYLALCGVAVVVFLGIIEAGWLARKDNEKGNSTERPVYHQKAVFVSVDKKTLSESSITDQASWTPDLQKTTTWKTLEEKRTPGSTLSKSTSTEIPGRSPGSTLSKSTTTGISPSPNLRSLGTRTNVDGCVQKTLTKEYDAVKWEQSAETCEAWLIDVHTICAGIDITVEKINLNAELNEYLIIAPRINQLKDEGNPMITWTLSSERKFRMMGGTAYLQLKTNASSSSGTLYFVYTCYGKGTVSTEPPTTEIIPTEGPEDYETITLYTKGKTQYEFAEAREEFQTVVSLMANEYCKVNNISLNTEAKPNNTIFSYIGPCMVTWPDSNICVKVKMAVSLNTTGLQYELTREHLQDMWSRYAEKYLSTLGLEVYNIPDDEFNLLSWVGVSVGVLLVFILLLGLISYWQPFRVYKKMKPDEPYEQTPRITEIYPSSSAIMYEPGSAMDFLPPKSPEPDCSTDDMFEVRNSIAQLDTIPKYGPPAGFGAAIHFFGKTHNRDFQDLELVAEESEEAVNQTKLSRNGTRAYGISLVTEEEEEVDTSKNLYIPEKRNSLHKTNVQNYYEDEPGGYNNLAYTDNENLSKTTSEEIELNDNFSLKKSEGGFNDGTARHSFKENSLNSFLQAKETPNVIEEEEEEDTNSGKQNLKDNISKTTLQTLNSLASLAEEKEELYETEPDEASRNSGRPSGEKEAIYDIPKFPVRRLSADTDL